MSVVNVVDQMFGNMFAEISDALLMSDEEMYAGLDDRLVAHLRAVLVEKPELRVTLCQGARYRATRVTQTKRPPEFVYFIQATVSGLVKIGSASDPGSRLRTLQTGSPERLRLLATMDGGEPFEREMHARFAADRSHGEWFYATPELLDLIAGAA